MPATLRTLDGVQAWSTGGTAVDRDFNASMLSHLPLVFAFVLVAAFLLLLVTFRSVVVPITAIVLNLLSVGAAYGALVLVFQHGWLNGLLGVGSTGPIVSWLPLCMVVVLFGLSMDYHVFVLSRVRELVDRGMSTENAVSSAIKSTAGVVTSAAVVMVCVFAVFGTLSWMMFKQMGVGLAFAIRRDAHPRRPAAGDDGAPRRAQLVAAERAALPAPAPRRGRGPPGPRVARGHPATCRRPPSPGGRRSFVRQPAGSARGSRPGSGTLPDDLRRRVRHPARMPAFLLHHEHAAAECDAAFAAWTGFDSPLRHRPAASSCLAGGHALWWRVEALSSEAALALLPRYLRRRTVVTRVRDVEIP